MGPRPVGNPDLIRAVAAQLSSYAEQLAHTAAGVRTILPADIFVGPGRAKHDAEFDHASARGRAGAHTLELESASLAREAGDLEQRQRAWDAAKRAEDERKRQDQLRRDREADARAGACVVRPPR